MIPKLCDRGRLALDVGANAGVYSAVMRRHARLCHAFEPNPDYAWVYRRVFGDVIFHSLALSDRAGRATFQVPVVEDVAYAGWGTLERPEIFAGYETREFDVELARLDGLGLDPIGLIKIDVEGHELEVLRGGQETLRRDRPAVLVEAEERHRKDVLTQLFALMESEGYRGYFLLDGRLTPLAAFDPERHQKIDYDGSFSGRIASQPYVMNFLFLSRAEQAERLGISFA